MIWLNPLALAGVAAIVAPILIHILVQRRAPPFPFPTLRFLRPTRLAAIRRHVLEDVPLLIVRAAVFAVAAAALAGPLLVTPARRAAWNARVARAVVVYRAAGGGPSIEPGAAPSAPAAFQTAIETSNLRDGIARASAWLEAAPPARRELVVIAPFTLGSLSRADLADVPAGAGIRLVRAGELPSTRSFAAPAVLEADLSSSAARRRDRTVELNGPSTLVRESAPAGAAVPIEIVGSADVKRAGEATLAAVLSQRVPAPVAGRSARVVFDPVVRLRVSTASASAAIAPWIAGAIARVTTEPFSREAAEASGGVAAVEPSMSVAADADGKTLVVTTNLPPSDMRAALLFRSIFAALAAEDGSETTPAGPSATAPAGRSATALAEREILPIPDADLRAWERPAGDVRSPRLDAVEHDDRRWWWAAALVLLAVESVLRRSRRPRVEQIGDEEAARVA